MELPVDSRTRYEAFKTILEKNLTRKNKTPETAKVKAAATVQAAASCGVRKPFHTVSEPVDLNHDGEQKIWGNSILAQKEGNKYVITIINGTATQESPNDSAIHWYKVTGTKLNGSLEIKDLSLSIEIKYTHGMGAPFLGKLDGFAIKRVEKAGRIDGRTTITIHLQEQ